MTAHNPLSGDLLIVALEGWTDAGEAASSTVRYLKTLTKYTRVYRADSDRYLDYQFTRPQLRVDRHGQRKIVFPDVSLYRQRGERDGDSAARFHLLVGAEPARRWKRFTAEILDEILALEVSGVIFLGALLSDTPHTRPIPVQAQSINESVREQLDIEPSQYEGPIGYLSVLAQALEDAGIPSLTIWASVPHYAHGTPSPKAASALVKKLEQLTGAQIPHGELDLQAVVWESTLNALAEDDEELRGYITQLEQARDTEDAPSTSGDSIAAEIERYLKRKDDRRGSAGGAFE